MGRGKFLENFGEWYCSGNYQTIIFTRQHNVDANHNPEKIMINRPQAAKQVVLATIGSEMDFDTVIDATYTSNGPLYLLKLVGSRMGYRYAVTHGSGCERAYFATLAEAAAAYGF